MGAGGQEVGEFNGEETWEDLSRVFFKIMNTFLYHCRDCFCIPISVMGDTIGTDTWETKLICLKRQLYFPFHLIPIWHSSDRQFPLFLLEHVKGHQCHLFLPLLHDRLLSSGTPRLEPLTACIHPEEERVKISLEWVYYFQDRLCFHGQNKYDYFF